jgi:hypothetical protein
MDVRTPDAEHWKEAYIGTRPSSFHSHLLLFLFWNVTDGVDKKIHSRHRGPAYYSPFLCFPSCI